MWMWFRGAERLPLRRRIADFVPDDGHLGTIWRANCAVAVFVGHAGTHGACKPGCGMGTPLRKATAQKRASRIFSRGKQTKPGPAPRRGIGGGLRAGRAAAVRRATLPVLWRIGQDAMCSACHCPPLASRPETQWARYGFTDRAAVSLRATLPVLRRTGRDAGAYLRQANQTGASTSSRDRWRLARRPCSCCPARHPARIMAHRTGRDVLRVPLPAAGKQAGDAVGAVWIYRPRSRLFARHPSRIAAHRARCRRFPAASNPGPAPRRGISGGQRRLVRRPCSCCPARHPARILVLRWSAQDAAAEPNEYALDCASDRKAYA